MATTHLKVGMPSNITDHSLLTIVVASLANKPRPTHITECGIGNTCPNVYRHGEHVLVDNNSKQMTDNI